MIPGSESFADPAALARMLAERERIGQLMVEQQLADRRRVLAWSAILCSCDPRYVAGTPSQADCLVHGVFLIHPDGTII